MFIVQLEITKLGKYSDGNNKRLKEFLLWPGCAGVCVTSDRFPRITREGEAVTWAHNSTGSGVSHMSQMNESLPGAGARGEGDKKYLAKNVADEADKVSFSLLWLGHKFPTKH